jgi:MFS family permease
MPSSAWVLFAGTFVNRFGSFVLVFLVLWLRQKGYSATEAGAAVSAYGFGSLASAVAGGWVADRFGRRNSIALSMFSAAATMLALSQADRLGLIVVLSALAGFTSELYRPASGALLADIIPAGRRVTAFALYRLAINLGFAAGPATAGLLAERSFFLLFLGEALTSAAFGLAALLFLPHGVRSSRTEERPGELVRAVRADRVFQLFLVASLLSGFVYFQGQVTLPLHVRDAGFSYAVYGALISLNGAIIVLLTAWTQRLPPRPVMAAGLLLEAGGFALVAVAFDVPFLAFTVVVWTVGEIVFAPVASAWVADIAPERLRGRYQGAWSLTWGLALVVAPIGTAVYEREPAALWLLCGALGVAGAALLAPMPPVRRTRRTGSAA